MTNDTPTAIAPWWLLLTALVGSISGLFGIYWDEAWHTDIGRDTFWSPPHMFMYVGIALVGAAVAVWTWTAIRRREIRRPMVVALSGAVLTLASGPIDDWWHVAFGRDAVVWSPPHMAALAGVILLIGSLLIEGSRFPGRRGQFFAAVASAGLLAAVLVAVYEYEGDVPQFPVVLYLPMLAGLTALGFGMIRRVSPGVSHAASRAAAVYTGLMALVMMALAVLGHSLPAFTIILGPALVFDRAQGRSQLLRAAFHTIAVFGLYVPFLNFALDGVYISGSEMLIGVPAAFLLSWAGLAAVEGVRRIPLRRLVAAAGLLILLVPGTALAHDPGFGDDLAGVRLDARVDGTTAVVSGELMGVDCGSALAEHLTARRAGTAIESHLALEGCQLHGTVELPDRGRWFVYTDLTQDGQAAEAWIAVKTGADENTFQRDTTAYLIPARTSPPSKYLVGAVLYVIALGSLVYMVRVVRAFEPQTI